MDLGFWILLSGLIFIIPAVILIRNYIFVGSPSYLLFASLFGFVILDQVVVSLDQNEFIFEILISLSFVSIYAIVIQLSSDIIDNKLPISNSIWRLIALCVFLLTILLKYLISEEFISSNFTPLRITVGELYRIFAGYLIIYSFKNTKFVVESDKTIVIRKYWIISGYLVAITGILRSLLNTIVWFSLIPFNKDQDSSFVSNIDFASELIGVLSVLSLGVIVLYTALFYPETMLLSHVQVMRAARVYDIVERYSHVEDKNITNDENKDLIEYISSIPEEFIRKSK
ncbi:MAG: hypothetical protein ACXAD7_20965 [Candidatus Kariarchaeaceae archaeon]